MADQPQQPEVIDPDSVPETVCDGQFNVSVMGGLGGLATLTFTHVRPDPTAMFKDGRLEAKSIVRARIVITLANLAALRDLLNQVIQAPDTPTPPAGGLTHH
jgi:hypothetical protein